MHNPTNPTLEEVVSEIEENNQKIFNDPFDEIYLTMRDVYVEYLSDNSLCKKPYIYKEFMNHVEITLEDLDDTSVVYTGASEECRKWRVNGFEKELYYRLSREADSITMLVHDILNILDSQSNDYLWYDDYLKVEEQYRMVMKLVGRVSRSISEYYLQNLW
jgi:hypothetical protein